MPNEKKYIDAEKLTSIENVDNYGEFMLAIADRVSLQQIVDDAPAADVAEIKHGHNDNKNYAGCDEFCCSECGLLLKNWNRYTEDGCFEYEFKYCPECGARMGGEIK